MDREDVLAAILAGNEAAMQWYAITHDVPLPASPSSTVGMRIGPSGVSASFGGGTLIVAALVVVGVVLLIK